MTNTLSNSRLERELSPTQLATIYGFERHRVAWSCSLPAKAPQSVLKPTAKS